MKIQYKVIAKIEGNQEVCIIGEKGKKITKNKSRAESTKRLCEGFGLIAEIVELQNTEGKAS